MSNNENSAEPSMMLIQRESHTFSAFWFIRGTKFNPGIYHLGKILKGKEVKQKKKRESQQSISAYAFIEKLDKT